MRDAKPVIDAADVKVRRAAQSDIAVLRKFEQGIVAAERPYDPTIRKGEVHYYDIAALIASSEAFVAIAEIAGEPVGCGFVRKAASRVFTEPSFHAYIGLMYVTPDHRGRGVVSVLLDTLTAWAKSVGLFDMRLEVYPDNAAAVHAYAKYGFAPYMLEMRLTPGGE
jgi:GNAT superfamily N-acetyltransferase